MNQRDIALRKEIRRVLTGKADLPPIAYPRHSHMFWRIMAREMSEFDLYAFRWPAEVRAQFVRKLAVYVIRTGIGHKRRDKLALLFMMSGGVISDAQYVRDYADILNVSAKALTFIEQQIAPIPLCNGEVLLEVVLMFIAPKERR